MKKLLNISIVVFVLIGTLPVIVAQAQEGAPSYTHVVSFDESQYSYLEVFASVDYEQLLDTSNQTVKLYYGDKVAVTEMASGGDGAQLAHLKSPVDGYVYAEVLSDLTGYELNFALPDYSWLLQVPEYGTVQNTMNIRNSMADDAHVIGGDKLQIGDVVQILAKQGDWFLIRSLSDATGWVNNVNAQIVIAALAQPDWITDPSKLYKWPAELGRAQLIGADYMMPPAFYSPAGEPIADLAQIPGNIAGKGVPSKGNDHVGASLREGGVYNPILTRHGLWQRREGSAWSADLEWGMVDNIDTVETDPYGLVGELLAQDAYDFYHPPEGQQQYNPPFHICDVTGRCREFTRDEVLTWAVTERVLGFKPLEAEGQGGGEGGVGLITQNCPEEPTEFTISGRREGLAMRAGETGVPNTGCWVLVVYLGPNTPEGAIQVSAWQGARYNFPYIQDAVRSYYMPIESDAGQFNLWLTQNLPGIVADLALNGRNQIVFDGVPGFENGESIPISELSSG
jgi:hypothetical protein